MPGILEDVRIIDMTVAIAVPAAAAMMGDWGADVIKLEAPSAETQTRDPTTRQGGAMYMTWDLVNRNKRGLVIDLKKKEGVEVLHKLVQTADIFLSNFSVGTLRSFKADYETLSQINPRIIYCTLSAYGRRGPDKDQQGFDHAAAWARSGAEYLQGEAGSPPSMQLYSLIDPVTGGFAAAGILGALYHRERTGKGQQLETSLYHVGVWSHAPDIQSALMGAPPPRFKHSTGVADNPLWNLYRAKDGRYFQLAAQGGRHWPEFCRAIDRPDLVEDQRFSGGMDGLRQNCEELIGILDEIFATKTREEWEKRFRENNVIYGLVQTPMEVVKDPQAIANNFFADVDHPKLGKIKLVATPIDFHQYPAAVRAVAPERGQHTEEILLELGYSWEDIGRFKEQRVIL